MPRRTRPLIRLLAGPEILCIGLALVVAVVLLGSALRPGYALFLDHVTVPTPARPDWDHLTRPGGLRAWPLDGVLWGWSQLLPTWMLMHLFLVGSVAGAGVGAGLVLRHRGGVAMATAVLLAMANPYVIERLLLGQPALLLAYASLPWIVIASRQQSGRRRILATSAALLPAALTPWGAVVAGSAAVLVTLLRRRSGREVLTQSAVSIALWTPWLVPALVGGPGQADRSGATAFRLADDLGLGTFVSALAGGGVWTESATLPARHGPIGLLGVASLLILAVIGGARLSRRRRKVAVSLFAVAAGVPAMTAVLSGPLLHVWADMQALPGVALFRDLHRMLAPSVLALVLLSSVGVAVLIDRVAAGYSVLRTPLALVVPVSLAVLLVPGAPDRLRTAYEPRPFTSEWSAVMARVDNGRVLSLPWQPLRRAEWMPQSFLDPTGKALGGRLIADDTLTIARDGVRIAVMDSRPRPESSLRVADDTLRDFLTRGEDDPLPSGLLASSDIDHIVVWKGSPGPVPSRPSTWTTSFSGSDFDVWSGPPAASR